MTVIGGAAMVVVGLVLGLTPSSITIGGETIGCGSAFAPNSAAAAYQGDVNDCNSAFGSRRTIAWILVGVGAVIAVGGLAVASEL